MTQYSNFFADCPPELLSPLTLLTRGTKNKRWNAMALDVFKARGMRATVDHLESVKRMLNSPDTGRDTDWFWRYTTPAPRSSWLNHDVAVGQCRDCSKKTSRKFSGYWQCQTCSQVIQATVGGRKTLALNKGLAAVLEAAKESKTQRIADSSPAIALVA